MSQSQASLPSSAPSSSSSAVAAATFSHPALTTTASPSSHLASTPRAPVTVSTAVAQSETMAAAATMAMSQPHMAAPQHDERQELPRPYKCPLCDKAFHRLEHQTRHIRTHTGEKPHACQFPGCTKRFSRSDELTRHSRIHNNPNSRRGKQSQQHASTVVPLANGPLPEGQIASVMAPPAFGTYSGQSSNMASPNVSPPYTYNTHPGQYSNQTSPYGSYQPGGASPEAYARHGPLDTHGSNMNLLATAASHVARESDQSSYSSPAVSRHPSQTSMMHSYPHSGHSRHHPYDRSSHSGTSSRGSDLASRGSSTGLAAYHYSPHAPSMSRSHSHDEDDHYASHRQSKRSRPGSPYSTNPPSPTFSHGSYSPTPGHTPAMTPGHSPRLRAKHGHFVDKEIHLPGIRALSLHQQHQTPALEPLEPSTEASGLTNGQSYTPYSRSQNSSSTGLRITDIINREDGAARKLPIPTPPGLEPHDQALPSLSRSGESSAAGSVRDGAGGEWMDRR